ncbi:patatin family protein [Photobacterium sp. DA100]|uniref:patatin-like phospholipase family protein n=1 Tax=Photobacterium sp. DA100 TaxID=3027472 RepID=UPI00247B18E9|nr:patatin family protein [Photobacterium sp. DA100]WEM43706.1 patatin family protein [Photobacterium sp. DA100]
MTGIHISCAVNNVDALSHLPKYCDKIALVTEGGGQRGIFTAGVLDAFLDADYNPFSLLVGTSAGSLNIASFICGHTKHAYRVITEATTTHDFFDLPRFLLGKEGLNLDWLLEQTQTRLPLDWQQGHKNMRWRTVLACACHADNHRASFFDLRTDDWQAALKASCAIPVLRRQPILNHQQYWVDGGVGAPIPVQEAYDRGYRHIVVIRTVPISVNFDHCWMSMLSKALGKTKAAELISLFLEHEENYRQTQAFLNNPPDDATIYEIHPNKELSSKLLGSRLDSLKQDYQLGYQSGRYFMATLGREFSVPGHPPKPHSSDSDKKPANDEVCAQKMYA